jgi:hypothetical protein
VDPFLSSKPTKRLDAIEMNSSWPLKEYTQFSRPRAMTYYVHRSLRMLEQKFLDNSLDGYVELCKDPCQEFMSKFARTLA